MINKEEFNMEYIFSDFLVKVENNLSESERKELIEYITGEPSQTQRSKLSGQTGPIEFDESYDSFPNVMKVLSKRVSSIFAVVHKRLELSNEYYQKLDEYWINYSQNLEISFPHQHPQHCLVAVYYPKSHESSYLTLLNTPRSMQHIIPNGAKQELNLVTSNQYKVSPKEDLIFIFPAWLFHFVEQGITGVAEERLSVVFNSSLVKKVV